MMTNKRIFTSSKILDRISQAPISTVWTPGDFLDLGSSREAVEKVLQRMVTTQKLRRINWGLYDQLRINDLTGKHAAPDYHKVIDAIGRRDQVRLLVDGMTAANDLGLTNAVPGKVIVHTDARLRSIKVGQLNIHFKMTAASKLYWANRPAMRVVQSLYWLRDTLNVGSLDNDMLIHNKLLRLLQDPDQGLVIRNDLISGLNSLPTWMQDWIRNLLSQINPHNFKE